ncbi:unnamed protein product [Haemonchus placei]|uniref:Microtubule-associated protein n=1 Tax=Haemonchus placei TaxID=6290 RepID=A0A3P7ZUK0_HAEPC|nr:unnamed protein product [Haemonchus placei]
MISAKAISQPATPKVYRKVVAVSSKVGSFTDHKPSGGNVQIFSETRTYKVQPKVGSLNNVTHTPGGGNVKIPNIKLDFKEKAKPKIDAKSEYVPPVPEKKILSQKLVWNAQSKVGSLDNVKHKPAGGNVQILDQKLEWHAASKVGSMDNIKHKPGGGNVQVIRHYSAKNIGYRMDTEKKVVQSIYTARVEAYSTNGYSTYLRLRITTDRIAAR